MPPCTMRARHSPPRRWSCTAAADTDIGAGLQWFVEGRSGPIDLLIVVTDCHTPWPEQTPRFPVITIRVGDGAATSMGRSRYE